MSHFELIESNKSPPRQHIALKKWGARGGVVTIIIGFFASIYTLHPLVSRVAASPVGTCFAPPPVRHEVKMGENLACISERHYGRATYAEYICVFNRSHGRLGIRCLIEVGEVIFIPTIHNFSDLPALLDPPATRDFDYRCDDDHHHPYGDKFASY